MARLRILLLTQQEGLFLPESVALVCRRHGRDVVGIIAVPPLQTGRNMLNTMWKHMLLFGIEFPRLVTRVLRARLADLSSRPGPAGPFYSVRAVAQAYDIPFAKVVDVNSKEMIEFVDRHSPNLLASLSCPTIVRKPTRDRFALGCINLHGSPLPRYRGLMPAFWVLRNGEQTTAVSVHDLIERLDDGAILLQREVPISEDDTWETLVKKTKRAGAEALLDVLERIEKDAVTRSPNHRTEATYFSFPGAEDAREFRARGRRFF